MKKVTSLILGALLLGSSLVSAPANAAPAETENFVETQTTPAYAVGKSGERFYFDNVAQKLGISQPAAYWSPCGVFDKNEKLVRTFKRQAVKGISGRTAYLRCGQNKVIDGKNKGWGYRHIKAGHMNDWNNQAAYLGANWRDFADWATNEALNWSCSKRYQSDNKTIRYGGVYELRDSRGRIMKRLGVVTSVSATNSRVITSHPEKVTRACS